jgi:predicted amidohydrolase YtcJ
MGEVVFFRKGFYAIRPHKKYLDEVVCDRPVILIAYGEHAIWANSRALELAGVTHRTTAPPNVVKCAIQERTYVSN